MKSAPPTSVYNTLRNKSEKRPEVPAKAPRPEVPTPVIKVTGDAPASANATPKAAISQYLVRDESGQTSITSLNASAVSLGATEPSSTTLASPARSSPSLVGAPPSPQHSPNPNKDAPLPSLPRPPATEGQTTMDRDLPQIPSRHESRQTSSLDPASPPKKSIYDEEPYDFSKFDELFKPKVKLAPRPVVDVDRAKRPTAAGVSGLPANVRHSVRKQEQAQSSPVDPWSPTASFTGMSQLLPAPPPIPEQPEYQPRPISRSSVKSLPSHKSSANPADKLRLMKAMELRKRQMRKSNPQDPVQPLAAAASSTPQLPTIPTVPERSPMRDPKNRSRETSPTEPSEPSKADSGIGYDKVGTDETPQPSTLSREVVPEAATESESSSKPEGLTVQKTPEESSTAAAMVSESTKAEESQSSAMQTAPTSPVVPEQANNDTEGVPESITEKSVAAAPEAMESVAPATKAASSEETNQEDAAAVAKAQAEADAAEETSSATARAPSVSNASEVAEQSSAPGAPRKTLASRRRGLVEPLEPLQTSMPSGNPDDFSDDDELIEELKSATLQDALPVTMSKSPTVSTFDRRPSATSLLSANSDAAMSVKSITITKPPGGTSERIDSPEFLVPDYRGPEQSKTPLTYIPTGGTSSPPEKLDVGFSRNVSSGISRRIQALAENSNRESVISGYNVPARPLTPEMLMQQPQDQSRKPALRPPPSGRPTSFKRVSQRVSTIQPLSASGINPENAPVLSFQHDPVTNRNSVSVTARIIRPAAPEDAGANEPQLDPDLHLSQSYDTTSPIDGPSSFAGRQRGGSTTSNGSYLSRASTDTRTMHSSARFGRRHFGAPTSPSTEDFPHPPSSNRTTALPEDTSNAKESSRASRFLKRMSTLSNAVPGKRRGSKQTSESGRSNNRNSGATDRGSVRTVMENADMPPPCVVGDLNVQFPEALLWKRRIVTIDEAGNLQFSIASAMEIHKAVAVRKHHLSEFKLPYVPDAEQQELPHSVFLEFTDNTVADLRGTTIQAACEDAMTHRAVMHLLKSYHKAWTAPA